MCNKLFNDSGTQWQLVHLLSLHEAGTQHNVQWQWYSMTAGSPTVCTRSWNTAQCSMTVVLNDSWFTHCLYTKLERSTTMVLNELRHCHCHEWNVQLFSRPVLQRSVQKTETGYGNQWIETASNFYLRQILQLLVYKTGSEYNTGNQWTNILSRIELRAHLTSKSPAVFT